MSDTGMGAMTTAQIGRYSKGWMRRKAKKNNRPDFEVKNSHIEQAKHDMNLMLVQEQAVQNFNPNHDSKGLFASGSGGGKDVTSERLDEALHATGFHSEVGKLGSTKGVVAKKVLDKVGDGQRLHGMMQKSAGAGISEAVRISKPLLYSEFSSSLSKAEKGVMLALVKEGTLQIAEDNDGFVHIGPKAVTNSLETQRLEALQNFNPNHMMELRK